jgi:hypothetical protein
MFQGHRILQITAFVLSTIVLAPEPTASQQSTDPSCSETLTEQLRRFSEKCLSDLVSFVASQPNMSAKVYSEKEKYYLVLTRMDDGMLIEAVSKANYPLMKADTPDILKQLGWAPPENEADNWKKKMSSDSVRDGSAARQISEALAAYGLKQGEAISLTVGPKLSDKPTNG